jgi:ribosomal protein L12E/L44/L45/RPP1/RPP2
MGIAPIDLQTLFTQLDKVAKTQGAQREGQVLHQAMQGVQLQKKIEEHVQQVNEAQNTGEGVEKVNEREKHGQKGGAKKGNAQSDDGEEEEEEEGGFVLRDPNLGKKIDISL